jgi:hypothetical protein
LTPLQIREKLAALSAQVIPNKVEDFKELLKLKGSPNGGVDVTDDLKYTSAFAFPTPLLFLNPNTLTAYKQSNILGRTGFTFLPQCCGMGW